MKLCSIASGSSGNCIYVGTDSTHILVDAGISGKRTNLGLQQLGVDCSMLDGILITHEHIDHIQGLGVLARKYKIPIYATKGTMEGILRTTKIGDISATLFVEIQAEQTFIIKDIQCCPVTTSHDAAEPVAYRLASGNKKIGIATDLGTYNEQIVEHFRGVNALFLEANHDVNMLQVGPYPYHLKQRVSGNRGHLSNEMAGRLLTCLFHDNMQAVILGHLSEENNMPELAYETVRLELLMGKNEYDTKGFSLKVAKKSENSELIEIL